MGMDHLGDEQLLLAIAEQRDQEAFRELYARYKGPAYTIALKITGRASEAEDAFQEAMLRVWRYAKSYHAGRNPRSWILRILAHQAIARMHKQKRISQEEKTFQNAKAGQGSGTFSAHDSGAGFSEIIESLSPDEKQILTLRYAVGLTQSEIAKTCKVPERTISYRLQKTLEGLRAKLQRAGFAAGAVDMSDQALAEALCSGSSAPSGLESELMLKISDATEAIDSTARNPMWVTLTVTLGALTCMALAGYALNKSPASNSAKDVPPSLVTQENLEAPSAMPLSGQSWDFMSGMPSGISILRGEWKEIFIEEKKMGVLAKVKQVGTLLLPVRVPGKPLKLTVTYYPIDLGKSSMALAPADGGQMIPCKTWLWKPKGLSKKSNTIQFWIQGKYLAGFNGKKLVVITEFSKDLEGSRITLDSKNFVLRHIKLEVVTIKDLPKELAEFETTVKHLEALGAKSIEFKGAPYPVKSQYGPGTYYGKLQRPDLKP